MKKAVYTAIYGDYDDLMDPLHVTEGWDHICFTNRDDITSDVWKVIKKDLPDIEDTAKKARYIKLLYHYFMSHYDLTVWIDGNIRIETNIEEFVNQNHVPPVSFMWHSKDSNYEEAWQVIRNKKDDELTVRDQIEDYIIDCFPEEKGMVRSTGIMIRNRDGRVERFMEKWWEQVKKYSKRDQISLGYVNWKHPLEHNTFPLSYINGHNGFTLFRHKNKKEW